MSPETQSWTIGRWRVQAVECGGLSLDGGSMFGSVPRGLWERRIPADDHHRIPLATRLLLVRDTESSRQILVDTGVGAHYDDTFRERFAVIEPDGDTGKLPLERALESVGSSADEISDVLLTHLHFDHGGGAVRRDAQGEVVPLFPEATHWIQRANLDTARSPNPREKASYLPMNVDPLEHVRIELLDGDAEPMPGIETLRSDGHTDGMQIVRIASGDEVLLYPADLCPTHHHLPVAFTMGYDLCSREIMKEKERILGRGVDDGAIVVFEHDVQRPSGRIVTEKGRFALEAAE